MNALHLIRAAVEPTAGPVDPGTSFYSWCSKHIPCEGDKAPLLLSVRGVTLAVSSSDRRYYNLEVRAPSGAALWFYGLDRNNGPVIAVEFNRDVNSRGRRATRIATAPDSIVHDATTPKEFLKALFSIKSRGASILDRLLPQGAAHAATEPVPRHNAYADLVDAVERGRYQSERRLTADNVYVVLGMPRTMGVVEITVHDTAHDYAERMRLRLACEHNNVYLVPERGARMLLGNLARFQDHMDLARVAMLGAVKYEGMHKAQAAVEPEPVNDLHGAGLTWWGDRRFNWHEPKRFKINSTELCAYGPQPIGRHNLSIRAGDTLSCPELRYTLKTTKRLGRMIEVTYASRAGLGADATFVCRVPESLIYTVRNEAELVRTLCGIRTSTGKLALAKLLRTKSVQAAAEPAHKLDAAGLLHALHNLVEVKGHGTHRFEIGKYVVCLNGMHTYQNKLPVALNVLAYETGNNLAACKYVLELKESRIDLSSGTSAWARRYEHGTGPALLKQILKDIVDDMKARYAKAASQRYGG